MFRWCLRERFGAASRRWHLRRTQMLMSPDVPPLAQMVRLGVGVTMTLDHRAARPAGCRYRPPREVLIESTRGRRLACGPSRRLGQSVLAEGVTFVQASRVHRPSGDTVLLGGRHPGTRPIDPRTYPPGDGAVHMLLGLGHWQGRLLRRHVEQLGRGRPAA